MKKSEPSKFDAKCYRLISAVPRGKVTTYREIAKALGHKGFRAVGQAMGRNPYAPKVPCHRVVRSDGSLGGYAFGLKKKVALLKAEGVAVRNGKVVNFSKHLKRL